jgi:hypothetical protein
MSGCRKQAKGALARDEPGRVALPALEFCDGAAVGALVRADARDLAAQLVRLTVRALEVHARDAIYLPGEWIAAGVVLAVLYGRDASRASRATNITLPCPYGHVSSDQGCVETA